MAGFLYFVPEAMPTASREVIERFGLGYAFESPVSRQTTASGPGGQSGSVVIDKSFPGFHGFKPEIQEWTPMNENGVFVGYEKAHAPKPRDLERSRIVDGLSILLGDGNRWTIPVARRPVEVENLILPACSLPQKLALINGTWQPSEVLPEFIDLWELAGEVWDYFMEVAESGESGSLEDEIRRAVLALKANYRISQIEASVLGLFDTSGAHIAAILKAVIDYDAWVELLQKKSRIVS